MNNEKLTAEELYVIAFDKWGDAKKKLSIKEAFYEKVSYQLRRNPQGSELMKNVFSEMRREIEILSDRVEDKAREVNKILDVLKEKDFND